MRKQRGSDGKSQDRQVAFIGFSPTITKILEAYRRLGRVRWTLLKPNGRRDSVAAVGDVLDTRCRESAAEPVQKHTPRPLPQAMAGCIMPLQRLPQLWAVASDAKGSPMPSIDPSTGPLP